MEIEYPKYDALLFDLDDTLYPLSSGIARECGQNIKDYMVEKLGIDKSKILELSNSLYKNYGTTMAGLRAIGYNFDYDDFIHGRLPYENIKPDPILRSLLLSLPLRKIIFTNADKLHAARALEKLGLEDCFQGIVCFESLNTTNRDNNNDYNNEIFDIIGYLSDHKNPVSALPKTPIVCKPSENAIVKALEIADIDPQRTLFFDDSVRNTQAGKHIGLSTVLVGTSQKVKFADYALENIHNLKEALPELWESEAKPEKVRYSGKLAVETPVIA
ncbi:unnamed protein product [Arabis nemorensis]|uniref:Uncharacterized protein n=1 Tax=Arabis nemorensis TaxID=586526 RepID=A0A565BLR7_9BRAS|nr:unnamed protein product [Arabis nemorensis]